MYDRITYAKTDSAGSTLLLTSPSPPEPTARDCNISFCASSSMKCPAKVAAGVMIREEAAAGACGWNKAS